MLQLMNESHAKKYNEAIENNISLKTQNYKTVAKVFWIIESKCQYCTKNGAYGNVRIVTYVNGRGRTKGEMVN